MTRTLRLVCCAAALFVWTGASVASAPPEQIAELGRSLTPVGAERAGNRDGTIPAWTGGYTTVPPGYVIGAPRIDPFAGEKPLYSITAANLDRFADRLPEGQKALFARDPAYRIDVYSTHRTAALPTRIYDNIRVNAARAHAGAQGIAAGVDGAIGGVPFPIPRDGFEAIWNHLLAFWGVARAGHVSNYFIAADGRLERTNAYHERVEFPYYDPSASLGNFAGYSFKRREMSDGPPSLAGRGYLLWQPVDLARQPIQAWQYLPRERRVRRSPLLSYDTPTPDGAGIESFDDYYVYSGSPDRYEFRLLGKREMIVPYNNNGFHRKPVADVVGPGHLRNGALRYELHRVWVVEATLAAGKRHIVPKRRFYLDEDTWFAVYADAWDADGRLWKFSHGTMYLVPDLPAVVLGSHITYDLVGGGYVFAFAFNDEPVQYKHEAPQGDLVFSPEGLARETPD
ncbi:DUF1329 domain-containing protein [Roseiterribacter gracilis]|uniref:Outer membrane lipoprotein-sorting protein n=1 Tax=Roseiterribacter gracilis TaxID=2812848 RepID=A0A8S8XDW4_9PROT|nr:hypothetical protein TMPK1_22860 [Rhodospirillales bacterium TMPK1]